MRETGTVIKSDWLRLTNTASPPALSPRERRHLSHNQKNQADGNMDISSIAIGGH